MSEAFAFETSATRGADAPDGDAPADATARATEWTCATCGTLVEGEFDVCWRCGTTREGVANPESTTAEDAPTAADGGTALSDQGPDPDPTRRPPGVPPSRVCAACAEPLVPIRLIDSSGRYGFRHEELRYAAGDASPGLFFGYPLEGIVRAALCPRCGRVSLYAVPTARA